MPMWPHNTHLQSSGLRPSRFQWILPPLAKGPPSLFLSGFINSQTYFSDRKMKRTHGKLPRKRGLAIWM